MRLVIINSYPERRVREAVEEGRVSGSLRGMEALCPYDMDAQESLCLAWMHGQWRGSMGSERVPCWNLFKKTDGYKRLASHVVLEYNEEE